MNLCSKRKSIKQRTIWGIGYSGRKCIQAVVCNRFNMYVYTCILVHNNIVKTDSKTVKKLQQLTKIRSLNKVLDVGKNSKISVALDIDMCP